MTELLKILALGDVNIGAIIGIIGLLLLVKKFDTNKILGGGFYLIAVVLLGLIIGLVLSTGKSTIQIVINGLTHAGISSLIYQYGEKLLPVKKLRENESKKFIIFRRNQ